MLGKRVYFIDFKNKCVSEGDVVETHITTSGYPAAIVKTEKGEENVEIARIYFEKLDAEYVLPEKLEIARQMNEIVQDSNKKIHEGHIKLYGEPTLKHLVEKNK